MVVKKNEIIKEIPRFNIWSAVKIIILLFFISFIFSGCLLLFSDEVKTGNVAVIPIDGVIVTSSDDGIFSSSVTTSSWAIKQLKDAEENTEIDAIVLKINSPGGTPVASADIANYIKKTNKPTVAWVQDGALSGAYWIASGTDHIISHQLSLVGSIGVIGSYLDFSELLDDYNVTYTRLVAGKYKDIGSPFKKMTFDEKMFYQSQLDRMHSYFIEEVAINRNMSIDDVTKLSDGLFYVGLDAVDLGLVDELGSEMEVISYLNSKGIENVEFRYYNKKSSFFDSLTSMFSNVGFSMGRGMTSNLESQSSKASLLG